MTESENPFRAALRRLDGGNKWAGMSECKSDNSKMCLEMALGSPGWGGPVVDTLPIHLWIKARDTLIDVLNEQYPDKKAGSGYVIPWAWNDEMARNGEPFETVERVLEKGALAWDEAS